MTGNEAKTYFRKAGRHDWEIGRAAGVSETTICRLWREATLSEKSKALLIKACEAFINEEDAWTQTRKAAYRETLDRLGVSHDTY